MPCYRVTNRVSGEAYSVEAPYAQDACEALGWMIGDCHVREVHDPRPLGEIPQGERPVTVTRSGDYRVIAPRLTQAETRAMIRAAAPALMELLRWAEAHPEAGC